MTITISTWGLKHGPLPKADAAFDCRTIYNPHMHFPTKTGLDAEVQDMVRVKALPFVAAALEALNQSGIEHVQFYCVAGRHRSVACAVMLSQILASRRMPHELRIHFG